MCIARKGKNKVKGKGAPVRAVKAYRENRVIAALIIN
jgi:hypothetical protein